MADFDATLPGEQGVDWVWFTGSSVGSADAVGPSISGLSPAAGSELGKHDPISFNITDEGGLAAVVIIASYPTRPSEVVHDGTSFRDYFTGSSNKKTAITNGFSFTVSRGGGWPEAPTLEWIVIDNSGNSGVIA